MHPSSIVGRFRDRPPAAVVIDLDKLPSHGRAVAVVLRSSKSTCHLPIVFAGGLEEKVQRAREQVPAAVFTAWPNAAKALRQVLKKAPAVAMPQPAYMQQFAGSSLVKKLGLKAGQRVALLGAPDAFEELLGELPDGAQLDGKLNSKTGMAIWFVHSRRELETEMEYLSMRMPPGASLWIVYPKQTSRFKVDFTQNDVRGTGLAAGWVDYKICSVDSDWTGLKFARKKVK